MGGRAFVRAALGEVPTARAAAAVSVARNASAKREEGGAVISAVRSRAVPASGPSKGIWSAMHYRTLLMD